MAVRGEPVRATKLFLPGDGEPSEIEMRDNRTGEDVGELRFMR